MKQLFRPARATMAQLSFTGKFLLVLAIIGLPLLYLAGQLVVNLATSVQQTKRLTTDVAQLRQMTLLIRSLETMRNVAPIKALTPTPRSERIFTAARKQALDQLARLIRSDNANSDFRGHGRQLRQAIDQLQLIPGSEGFQVQQVFQSAQHLVSQAYEWRQEQANRDGLFAARLSGLEPLNVFLFSRAPNLLMDLGAAQAFGSFFLKSGFIHSGGASLMDQTWQNLDTEIRQLNIGKGQPSGAYGTFIAQTAKASKSTLNRFDQDLIQVVQLQTPWQTYYDGTQTDIQSVDQAVDHAFDQLDTRLSLEHRTRLHHLLYALSGLTLGALIILYLLVGFYLSVKSSVNSLIRAASRVSHGDLDTPVTVATRDEIHELSLAFDQMRQQLKVREEALRDFSLRDGLTGLYNRRFFDEALDNALSRAIREQTWLSLVMLDLDHFKQVNDTCGHLAGDAVLKQAARLFEQIFRRGTDIIARYGGEEFAIILPETEPQTALELAENLRRTMAEKAMTSPDIEGSVNVSASLGVATLQPGAPMNVKTLLHAADEALYNAKRAGRNRVEHRLLAPPQSKSGASA